MLFALPLLSSSLLGEEPVFPGMEGIRTEGPEPAELVKQLKQDRERALKEARERAKKEAARRTSSKDDLTSDLDLLNPGLPQVRWMDRELERKSGKRQPLVFMVETPESKKGQPIFTIDESGRIRAATPPEGINDLSREALGGDNPLQPGRGMEIQKPAKRSFWDRLLGRRKEPDIAAEGIDDAAFAAGAPSLGLAQASASGQTKGSMLQRVRAEMARKRLEAERSSTEPDSARDAAPTARQAPPGKEEGSGATVPDPASAGAPAVAPGPPGQKTPGADAETDLRAQAERRFQIGLAARDVVERDWAFRYAAAFRREEAAPVLLRELTTEGPLAALAAACLAEAAPRAPGAADALIKGLSSNTPGVRQSCVEALGRLQATGASRPLLKLLKGERNHLVRAASCEALGLIGDRDAISSLRERLSDADESQLVRAQAAVALARLGDSSGDKFLASCTASPVPTLQALGLAGQITLNAPVLPAQLTAALQSPHEEVWITAVRRFPSLGAARALPMLRLAMISELPQVRCRAALATGLLGVAEGLPYIEQALLEGGLAERQLAATLLGTLGHRGAVPLLIERLRDPSAAVRQASAVALVQLDAKEALSALTEAARGPRAGMDLAISRGGMPEVGEMLTLLSCIRALRGEKEDLVLKTRPDVQNLRWPEYDRELLKYQLDVLRAYRFVEVMGAPQRPVGVVLRDPQGREQLFREGEMVAVGFRVRDLHAGGQGDARAKDPPWVTLIRGDTRVTLSPGREADVSLGPSTKKDRARK